MLSTYINKIVNAFVLMRYYGGMNDELLSTQKIVIAEDNPALADIYSTRLEMIGYRCFVAHDGQQALEIIEREKPALVLMDMMMPLIAGDEVLRRMRATEWGKNVRVYIISNLNEIDAPAGLRDLGIEGYAVKANLTDDDIDRLVDNILKPVGQNESIHLD
jgi:CheY-like chemotaxis protein